MQSPETEKARTDGPKDLLHTFYFSVAAFLRKKNAASEYLLLCNIYATINNSS